LEQKRFIGNDMARIFARVRRELGPEAVILQTRSLIREGADPLIEVMAANPEVEAGLSVALQRVMLEGVLDRVEAPANRPSMTIGDLEDIAAREEEDSRAQDEFARAYAEQMAGQPAEEPDWLQGFVEMAGAPDRPHGLSFLEQDLLASFEPVSVPAVEPPAPIEWAPRPRIVTRNRPAHESSREPEAPSAFEPPRRFAPVEPGLAGRLIAAGFSADAARRVAHSAGDLTDPVLALERNLAARNVGYPVEKRTAIITIQGAPGSGRTTALMRMALDCADAGREAVLVAADMSHTGGRAQVHAYGEAIGLPVFDAFAPQDLVQAVTRAPKGACIFVDVPAGQWAPPPIPGVEHFVYLAVPAHWQPSVLTEALEEFDHAGCAGAVITGVDLATELTPALSLLVETQLGIAFLSSGRDVGTGIEVADPLTLASGVFTTSTRETTNGRLAVTA